MIKVYQKVVDGVNGDCARAVVASLFELELESVPNFIETPESFGYKMLLFYRKMGYVYGVYNERPGLPTLLEVAKFDGGIDGYFYASVPSKTYEGGFHAVIIDSDLKVVHDPNPNQNALCTRPEEIQSIVTASSFHVNMEGKLIRE